MKKMALLLVKYNRNSDNAFTVFSGVWKQNQSWLLGGINIDGNSVHFMPHH